MGKKGKGKLPPAFDAADTDDWELLEPLLTADPSLLTKPGHDGWTLLHQACFGGSLSVVNQLLRMGADVMAVCQDKCLPAHYASAQGHVEVISALVSARGPRQLSTADRDGETALDVCLNGKVKKAIEAIQAAAEEAAAKEDEGEDGEDGEEEG